MSDEPEEETEVEVDLLETLELESASSLYVNVDFNALLDKLGDTGAFDVIGKLKDLLA